MLHDRVHVARAFSEIGAELQIDRVFDIPVVERGRERIHLDAPVALESTLQNVGGDLLLTGTLTTHVQAECSRCLGPAPQDITLRIEELVARDPSELEDVDENVPEDEFPEYYSVEDEHLDIGPIVMQALLLGLPDKPICKEECAGLCPTCGADRNHESCEHEGGSAPADPRWDALKGLTLSDSE